MEHKINHSSNGCDLQKELEKVYKAELENKCLKKANVLIRSHVRIDTF